MPIMKEINPEFFKCSFKGIQLRVVIIEQGSIGIEKQPFMLHRKPILRFG